MRPVHSSLWAICPTSLSRSHLKSTVFALYFHMSHIHMSFSHGTCIFYNCRRMLSDACWDLSHFKFACSCQPTQNSKPWFFDEWQYSLLLFHLQYVKHNISLCKHKFSVITLDALTQKPPFSLSVLMWSVFGYKNGNEIQTFDPWQIGFLMFHFAPFAQQSKRFCTERCFAGLMIYVLYSSLF